MFESQTLLYTSEHKAKSDQYLPPSCEKLKFTVAIEKDIEANACERLTHNFPKNDKQYPSSCMDAEYF